MSDNSGLNQILYCTQLFPKLEEQVCHQAASQCNNSLIIVCITRNDDQIPPLIPSDTHTENGIGGENGGIELKSTEQ